MLPQSPEERRIYNNNVTRLRNRYLVTKLGSAFKQGLITPVEFLEEAARLDRKRDKALCNNIQL